MCRGGQRVDTLYIVLLGVVRNVSGCKEFRRLRASPLHRPARFGRTSCPSAFLPRESQLRVVLSVDFRNALLDLSTWHGVRRTWYEVLSATTEERRAECEALGTECGVLTTAYFVRRDECGVIRATD